MKKLVAICVVAGLVVGAMSAYGAGPEKGKPAVKSGKAAPVVKADAAKAKPKADVAKPKPKGSKPGVKGRRGPHGPMAAGQGGPGPRHGRGEMRGRMRGGSKGGRGQMMGGRQGRGHRGGRDGAKKPESTKTK